MRREPCAPGQADERSGNRNRQRETEQQADRAAAHEALPGGELAGLLELDAPVAVLDHDRRVAQNELVLVAELANGSQSGIGEFHGVVGDGDEARARQLLDDAFGRIPIGEGHPL